MNFFNWIRDGVRQAVLYGVSDAVGEIGEPADGESMNKRLLEVLRNAPEPGSAPRLTSSGSTATATASPKRRRLGRSLSDIQSPGEE